jgi:5-methylcytosine-specific restriction endonuclease McrA
LARKFEISIPKTLRRFKAAGGSIAYLESRFIRPDTYKQKPIKGQYLKANPYTMQQQMVREELGQDARWYGYEARPGQSDLKLAALERDAYTCQMCGKDVRREESEVDHIKPVKRYKRPVEANQLSNLWTLCVACHKWKTTEYDQRVESRVR